ncbi:hypothetical protein Q2941_42190 [Bradyrhizobium sp. UFLA05-153]
MLKWEDESESKQACCRLWISTLMSIAPEPQAVAQLKFLLRNCEIPNGIEQAAQDLLALKHHFALAPVDLATIVWDADERH